MASSCVTIPTFTTDVEVIQSTETIVTSIVSTLQPTTTIFTTLDPSCSQGLTTSSSTTPDDGFPTSTSASTCTVSTVTSVIPGSETTIEATQTSIVEVTNVIVNTIFDTSCTPVSSSESTWTSVSSANFIATSTSPSSASITSWSTSDPSASIFPSNTSIPSSSIVSSSTTSLSNASTAASTSSLSTSSAGGSGGHGHGPSSKMSMIIGGTLGGFFGLVLMALLIWILIKHPSELDDLDKKEPLLHPKPRPHHQHIPRPKPYKYSRVPLPPIPQSPPTSPTPSINVEDMCNSPVLEQRSPDYFPQHRVSPSQDSTHMRLLPLPPNDHNTTSPELNLQPSPITLGGASFGVGQSPVEPTPTSATPLLASGRGMRESSGTHVRLLPLPPNDHNTTSLELNLQPSPITLSGASFGVGQSPVEPTPTSAAPLLASGSGMRESSNTHARLLPLPPNDHNTTSLGLNIQPSPRALSGTSFGAGQSPVEPTPTSPTPLLVSGSVMRNGSYVEYDQEVEQPGPSSPARGTPDTHGNIELESAPAGVAEQRPAPFAVGNQYRMSGTSGTSSTWSDLPPGPPAYSA